MLLLNDLDAYSNGMASAAQGHRIVVGPETAPGATLVLEVLGR
jgi:hypothetical protein